MRRGLAVLSVAGWPSQALACAACVAAADRNRTFFVMTIVLSLLPLVMIAGGLWWVARHARGRLRAEFEERESPAPAGQALTFSAAGPAGETPGTKNADSRSDLPAVLDPTSLRSRATSS